MEKKTNIKNMRKKCEREIFLVKYKVESTIFSHKLLSKYNIMPLFVAFLPGIVISTGFPGLFAIAADNLISPLPISTSPHTYSANGGNVILLNQRYIEERASTEIAGEVENNGTESVEYVKVTVTFYDSSDNIVGTQNTYSDPSDLRPGMKTHFEIFLTNTSIIDATETYGFTISWDNLDGSTGVTTVSNQSAGQEDDGGEEGQANEDGDAEENERPRER